MPANLKIFTVLSFLRIRSPDMVWYQLIWPLFLAIVVLTFSYFLPKPPAVFGNGGIVEGAGNLLNMLIGFYIAALAAVASFPSDTLNHLMKGQTPTITFLKAGQRVCEKLTRRRFLCMLFGYCAFISMTIYAFGAISEVLLPSLKEYPYFLEWKSIIKKVWVALYIYLCCSLIVTTLLGMHYLIERMHRE
jgi:hypothetical protein